ncbi:hypothetical protein Tco_0112244 [Tanacetum coccineum]
MDGIGYVKLNSRLTMVQEFLVVEVGNTKSPLSADTFGNNGVDESEASGPETPAKEVVDNGNGSALIFLYGYDTGSEVEQKSSKKGVDSGSGRRDYTLFGASLFAFLNPGLGYFARRRIWDPRINISSRQHLEGKVVVKESWNEARVRHASLKTDSPSVSQGTTFKAVVQPDLTYLPEISRKTEYF